MIDNARVTLAVAVSCVAASMLALAGHVLSHPMLSWLVHVDVRHLVVNVVAWLMFGLWAERLAGRGRMMLWVGAGLAVSLIAHAAAYPEHGTLYGMSSIGFLVFTAGIAAYAANVWWGWVMLAGVAGVLAYEWFTGGTSAAATLVSAGVGETPRLLPAGIHTESVVWVHIACAVMGCGFGVLARVAGRRDQRLGGAGVAPGRSYLISKP